MNKVRTTSHTVENEFYTYLKHKYRLTDADMGEFVESFIIINRGEAITAAALRDFVSDEIVDVDWSLEDCKSVIVKINKEINFTGRNAQGALVSVRSSDKSVVAPKGNSSDKSVVAPKGNSSDKSVVAPKGNSSERSAQDALASMDSKMRNVLDLKTYLLYVIPKCCNHIITRIGIREIFDSMDSNFDGKITREELVSLLYKMNKQFNPTELLTYKQQIEELCNDADVDGDGFISYEEFKMFILDTGMAYGIPPKVKNTKPGFFSSSKQNLTKKNPDPIPSRVDPIGIKAPRELPFRVDPRRMSVGPNEKIETISIDFDPLSVPEDIEPGVAKASWALPSVEPGVAKASWALPSAEPETIHEKFQKKLKRLSNRKQYNNTLPCQLKGTYQRKSVDIENLDSVKIDSIFKTDSGDNRGDLSKSLRGSSKRNRLSGINIPSLAIGSISEESPLPPFPDKK